MPRYDRRAKRLSRGIRPVMTQQKHSASRPGDFDWDALERDLIAYIRNTPSERFFAELQAAGAEFEDL